MPDRDPRIDPQRGDIIRGNGQVRRVMAREGDRVRRASGEYDYRMRLDNWQKWCRLNGATAVQVAASSRSERKSTAAYRGIERATSRPVMYSYRKLSSSSSHRTQAANSKSLLMN
jgi:hypothetical protein